MSVNGRKKDDLVVDKFASPEELILKQITSKNPSFLFNLKQISTVDGVVRFLEKENIHVDESVAQKLIIALRYFDVNSSGKVECTDSLENIKGGVGANPFIGLFRSLV